jgi:hypothetical protein
VLNHPDRLRVVDDHEVVVVLELLRVDSLVAAEDLLLFGVQPVRVALDRVVDLLGDVAERCTTRFSASGSASMRISSINPRDAIDA